MDPTVRTQTPQGTSGPQGPTGEMNHGRNLRLRHVHSNDAADLGSTDPWRVQRQVLDGLSHRARAQGGRPSPNSPAQGHGAVRRSRGRGPGVRASSQARLYLESERPARARQEADGPVTG